MKKVVIIQSSTAVGPRLDRVCAEMRPYLLVVGQANTARDGISLIRNIRPDLVLVDMDLPDGNGLKVFEATRHIRYEKVVLSHNHFSAIRTLRYDLDDYLLKQKSEMELVAELTRSMIHRRHASIREMYDHRHDLALDFLAVKVDLHLAHIAVSRIVAIVDMGKERRLEMNSNFSISTPMSLARLEKALACNQFFRINARTLVHLHHVMRFDSRASEKQVELSNGTVLDVDIARIPAFELNMDLLTQ